MPISTETPKDLPRGGPFYCGFSVFQMINVLAKHAERLEITNHKNGVRVYCSSDEYGEFENEGGLFSTLCQAFRPYQEIAEHDKKAIREALNPSSTCSMKLD